MIELWTADLKPSQLNALRGDPIIQSIFLNFEVEEAEESPKLDKRLDPNLDAELDMKLNLTLPITRNAGNEARGTTKQGHPFMITHPEIDLTPADVDGWIVPNPTDSKPVTLFPQSIVNGQEHGTKVLSKVIGKKVGVAKKAHVVCVQDEMNSGSIANALSKWRMLVTDAIGRKQTTKKNVIINFSRGTAIHIRDFGPIRQILRDIFKSLTDANIILVLAAGNDDSYQDPRTNGKVLMEQETAYLHPESNVTMAGFSNSDGSSVLKKSRYANVWAVGMGVKVADPLVPGSYTTTSGSSFTAPQISGLIATFLEDPMLQQYWSNSASIPKGALNLIKQTSQIRPWSRANQNQRLRLAYNLAHDTVCNANPNQRLARRLKAARLAARADKCVSLNPTVTEPALNPPTTSQSSKTSSSSASKTSTSTVPVITDGSGSGKCGNSKRVGSVGIDSKPIDKNKLQRCLKNLDTSKWLNGKGDASDCDGMVSFQSSSSAWKSAGDCYNSCKNYLVRCLRWCLRALLDGLHYNTPPLVTDGSDYPSKTTNLDGSSPLQQVIKAKGYKGIKDKYIDQYAVQDCIRDIDGKKWMEGDKAYNCHGILHFDMSGGGGWKSPSDCWHAVKNYLSDAVNQGASEAICTKSETFASCSARFYPK
ncbi:MAG: hypothetical protein M1814_004805 [Vezdaea aestivalis]|nr:MAG: hypothetical protein M1814_004805 [Vezdaea aestivalis]